MSETRTSANPRVSVIIPCRDAVRWIGETIASVLAQSNVAKEVIVIDDGSTDESVQVAAGMGPDVRVVWQTPQGVSAARNAGTQLAMGEFLQYLDADDVLLPGTLAARVAALEATGADVALTDWIRWYDGANHDGRADEPVCRFLGERPDVELLTDAWWPPGAVMYRRDIVSRIGRFRPDLPVIQDARFLLDAALAGARFTRAEGTGLKYRVRGGSLSRRDSRAFIADCFRSAADLHDRWASDGTLDVPRREGLLRVYAHVARPLFATDRAAFDQVWGRILTLDPAFKPEGPRSLRALTGLIGYPAAERVAWWWRAVKRSGRATT